MLYVKMKIGAIILLCALSGRKCDESSTEHSTSSHHGSKKIRCKTEPNASKKIEKVIKECENDLKIKLIRDTFLILKEEHANHHLHDHDTEDHKIYYHHSSHDYDAEDEQKNVNLHVVHDPKPTYDHNYNYNHHYEYPNQYVPHHEYQDSAPSSSSLEPFEVKNNYWPYPDQPSPMFGHKQINKRYWSSRPKRSTNHDIDDDNEAWKYNYELDENIHSATILPEDRWIAGCLINCILEKNNATDKHGWPTLDGLVAFYTDGVNEHEFFVQTLRFADHCLKGASHRHGIQRHMLPEKGQNCDLSFDVFDCITDKITEYCSHK